MEKTSLWNGYYANHLHTALHLTQLAINNGRSEKSPIVIFEEYMDKLKEISKK